MKNCLAVIGCDDLLRCCSALHFIEVGDHDRKPVRREASSNRQPDAAGRAGHNRSTCVSGCHSSLLRRGAEICTYAALVSVTLMHSFGFLPNSKASIPLVRSKK